MTLNLTWPASVLLKNDLGDTCKQNFPLGRFIIVLYCFTAKRICNDMPTQRNKFKLVITILMYF